MNVLFLGATGRVGRQIMPLLKEHFTLTLAAKGGGEVAGLPVSEIDITDWDSVNGLVKRGAADGAPFDAIINCVIADQTRQGTDPDEQQLKYFTLCIDVNARGAYFVYEAAWRQRVPRVVFVSSLSIMLGEPLYDHIAPDAPDRPSDLYAATKLFG